MNFNKTLNFFLPLYQHIELEEVQNIPSVVFLFNGYFN